MFLSMGQDHTFPIPLEMFQENRMKLWNALMKETCTTTATATEQSIIVLQGGPSPLRYDTDHEPVFRQESYFWWLTGVKEPDCWVVLIPNNNNTNGNTTTTTDPKCVLFIPKLPADYATIMGRIKTPEEWKEHYQVDDVQYTCDLEAYLLGQATKYPPTTLTPTLNGNGTINGDANSTISTSSSNSTTSTSTSTCTIYLMQGLNTDSGNMYNAPKQILESSMLQLNKKSSSSSTTSSSSFDIVMDTTTLFPIFAECRVIKSPMELQLLEHVAQVSSFAHAYVMRNTKPGMYEYQCESLFKHYAYYNYGSRLVSYTSICGCGPNAAILHYGHAGEPNARQIMMDDNCLFDMGAEYLCYASDITCSFPANGKFSEKFTPIYQGVLQAQIAVYQMAKPGVSWVDCHKAAEEKILQALMEIGIVTIPDNSSIPDLVEKRLGAVFMPHGLGHFLGIDTHDVGGYLPTHPPRSPLPGLRKLRTARILQPNMVLTVEPGCYFIDHLLDEAISEESPLKPYINTDKLAEYRGYGGCRLEDVVAITENDGLINFTVCPRTISEIEHVMAGGQWPPTLDAAPELKRVNLTSNPTFLVGQPAPPSK